MRTLRGVVEPLGQVFPAEKKARQKLPCRWTIESTRHVENRQDEKCRRM